MKFKDFSTIGKNEDFQKVYKNKNSFANKYMVIYLLETNKNNRIGVSISKKVGNSVIRHKIARLIRESYRNNSINIKNGYDLVIVAREEIRNLNYFEIEKSLIHILKKFNLLKDLV